MTCDDDEETFAEDNAIPHVTLRIYLAISQNDRVNCRWTTVVTTDYSVSGRCSNGTCSSDEHLCPPTTDPRFFLLKSVITAAPTARRS